MMAQPPQTHRHLKYNNNGKGWYFRFDDDKMSYEYILSAGATWMGQWNTYNTIYCKDKKGYPQRFYMKQLRECDGTTTTVIQPWEITMWKVDNSDWTMIIRWDKYVP